MIKRPKQVERSQKNYLSNEKYQDYSEQQFKTIYDYLDEYEEENADNKKNVYSTDETKIGVFVDGKTIYRKVFIINLSDYNSQDLFIAHNISDADLLWINHGESKLTNFYETLPTTYYYGSNSDWCRLWINVSNMRFKYANSGLSNYTLYIVVEYTKI
jgi:hypothetical protein